MKIIDEKGKLFGKINIIDLLIIVLIVAALVVVGVKVLGGDKADNTPTDPDTSETTPSPDLLTSAKLTYTVRVTAQREEVAEQLAQFVNPAEGKKDQLSHSGKLVEDAYVVDYWTEPCRYNVLASGEIEMIAAAEADAADLVDICLVVESVVEDTQSNKVGALEVRLGKTHLLKTAHMEFVNGFVTDCEWEPIEE